MGLQEDLGWGKAGPLIFTTRISGQICARLLQVSHPAVYSPEDKWSEALRAGLSHQSLDKVLGVKSEFLRTLLEAKGPLLIRRREMDWRRLVLMPSALGCFNETPL